MKKTFIIMALWTVVAYAQGLTAPLAGVIRDSQANIRPVIGIAGNFLLGNAQFAAARSAAFSGRFGLVKTDDRVLVLDEHGQLIDSTSAPEGDAIFAFDREGRPALAYFPDTGELRSVAPSAEGLCRPWYNADDRSAAAAGRCNPSSIETRSRKHDQPVIVASGLSGVVSLGVSGDMLIFRDGHLWRSLSGGLVPVSDRAFDQPPSALLWADGTVLVLSDRDLTMVAPDGSERHVTLDSPAVGLEQMSDELVLARPNTVLRVRDAAVYRLPEVLQ